MIIIAKDQKQKQEIYCYKILFKFTSKNTYIMSKQLTKEERKQFIQSLKKQPYSQIIQNKSISYSFAEKKNNSLIMHNDRYLLLFDSQYLGYFNQIQENVKLPFPDLKSIPSCKVQMKLSDITQYTNKKQVLQIIAKPKESSNIKQSKQAKQLKWIFRFKSVEMCSEWFKLIKQSIQRSQKKIKQSINQSKILEVQRPIIKSNSKYSLKENNNQTLNSKFNNYEIKSNNNQQPQFKQNKRVMMIPDIDQSKSRSQFFRNNSLKQSKKIQRTSSLIKQDQIKQQFPKQTSIYQNNIENNMSNTRKSNIENRSDNLKTSIIHQNNISDTKKQNQNIIIQNDNVNIITNSKLKKSSKINSSAVQNSPVTIFNPNQVEIKHLNQEDQLQKQIIKQFQKDWNQELIKNKQQVIIDFKIYCQALVCKIIDEMCLPITKRIYKPKKITSDYYQYQISGLFLKLCFTNLKEIKNKGKIYDQKMIKKINIEFKNMSYIFQTTRNSGRIRVPLSMIIQYKGIVTFVKSILKYQPNNIINEDLFNLSGKTRISHQIYNDPDSIKMTNYNDGVSKDNYIFFTQMNNYLPQDLISENNLQIKKLRAEFVQNEIFQNKKFIGYDILSSSQKKNKNISHFQQNQEKMMNLIKDLLDKLENLKQIVTNSEELTYLFHKNGVNMRYLGVVYENAKIPLVKKICMSQIIARLVKIILRKNLQEQIKKYNQKINPNFISDKNLLLNNSDQHLFHTIISFLNSLLRDSPQRTLIWQILNKQVEINFNIALNEQQIFEGYFIQAIIYHCNLQLIWNKYDSSVQIFRKKQYFTRQMFQIFKPKSKIYEFTFNQPYAQISKLIQQQTKQNFDQVANILELHQKQIPQILQHNRIYQGLILFLSNFISPSSKDPFNHLNIYSLTNLTPPSLFTLKLQINQIKWTMNNNNKQNTLSMFDNIMIKIKRWCGDYHPLLIQIYHLFSEYYLSRGQTQNAITASKSSLVNCIKTIGNNNLLIAQNYYELGNIYLKCGRKDQALNHYKKSKNILDINKEVKSIGYGIINLKIGSLYLNFGRLHQSIEAVLKSIQIFEKEQKYEQQFVQCYQILGRSYEVSNQMKNYKQLAVVCSQKLIKIHDPINLQSILKITIYPSFFYLSKKNAKRFLFVCNQLPLKFNSESYIYGYNFIKKFINKYNLIYYIDQRFKKFDQVLLQLQQSITQQKWKSIQQQQNQSEFSFVNLLQSLFYFLGQTFILGTLSR